MSRERGLPMTMSAAKRTFATRKGACVMDFGMGSQTRWEGPTNIGSFDTHTHRHHGLWEGVST